jgi:hypothetical protein
VRAIALAALLLTACDDIPKTRTESEIRSIAEDVADAAAEQRAAALQSQITELEGRIDQLETDKRELQGQVDLLNNQERADADSIQSLFKNDHVFAERLNIPMRQ